MIFNVIKLFMKSLLRLALGVTRRFLPAYLVVVDWWYRVRIRVT